MHNFHFTFKSDPRARKLSSWLGATCPSSWSGGRVYTRGTAPHWPQLTGQTTTCMAKRHGRDAWRTGPHCHPPNKAWQVFLSAPYRTPDSSGRAARHLSSTSAALGTCQPARTCPVPGPEAGQGAPAQGGLQAQRLQPERSWGPVKCCRCREVGPPSETR